MTYDIIIKQLIAPSSPFEVVYGSEGDQFVEPVVYFAVCDLIENDEEGDDDFLGVILPVVMDSEEGELIPELLSVYRSPMEQSVYLRRAKEE